MKSFILSAASLFSIFAFTIALANEPNISVKINGKSYSCSDSVSSVSPDDIGTKECAKKTAALESKNTACVAAGYSATSCFNANFSNSKIENCSKYSESCNSACIKSGYSATSCYNTCY